MKTIVFGEIQLVDLRIQHKILNPYSYTYDLSVFLKVHIISIIKTKTKKIKKKKNSKY